MTDQSIQSVAVPFIRLSAQETQSGHDRQKWAEGLILQLPEVHDGRNSWLINYGETDEAQAKRNAWNYQAVRDGRKPSCIFNLDTRSTGAAAPAPSSLAGGEDMDALDQELIDRGLRTIRAYDAVRFLRDALSATTSRLTGYDWNSDPEGLTKQQGDAFALADKVFADLNAAVDAHPAFTVEEWESALSPEAPARDGVPMLRVVPDTSVEGCYRLEDAPTPRHEAPAEDDAS